jgi:hypothetical protein
MNFSRLWGGKNRRSYEPDKKPGFSKNPVSAGSVSHGFYRGHYKSEEKPGFSKKPAFCFSPIFVVL